MVVLVAFFLTEIPVFKQFGQQNDLRTLRCRFADLFAGFFQTVGHLNRSNGYFIGHRKFLLKLSNYLLLRVGGFFPLPGLPPRPLPL